MSWLERLQQASFRNVPFQVEQAGVSGGRRLAVHEYPLRDRPFAEDLGRDARSYQVEAYVLASTITENGQRSGDYMAARDALIEALESGDGPGTLVHPYLGRLQVAVRGYRLSESTREGGIARFSIVFVEAGEAAQPATATDTRSLVLARSDALVESATADFSSEWSVEGLPEALVAELESELDRTLDGLTRLVGDVSGPIAAAIRAPGNMAVAIVGALGQVQAVASEPLRAIGMYESLFSAGESSPAIAATTGARRQQSRSSAALHRIVQRVAVAEAARQSALATFPTRDEALAVRDRLADAIDAQMEAVDPVYGRPVSDVVYQNLSALRAAVSADLRGRGAQLPSVRTIITSATTPALLLAHQIYGDASRAGEIVVRNNIRHPGFVPGGESLEVLNG